MSILTDTTYLMQLLHGWNDSKKSETTSGTFGAHTAETPKNTKTKQEVMSIERRQTYSISAIIVVWDRQLAI